MSFLNPKQDNPVKKYFEWKSDEKSFMYFDKEKEEKVFVQLPIKFVVLDELSTITGYNEKSKVGLYSNEVRDLAKEILEVKAFKNPLLITGLYKDIKDRATSEGGKFTKSVYAILYTKDSYEIVNFKLSGASIGGWIDKKFNTDKHAVEVNGMIEGKKGKVVFQCPVYDKGIELTDKIKEKLTFMALELESYLKSRTSQVTEQEHSEDNPNKGTDPVYHEGSGTHPLAKSDESISVEDVLGTDRPPILTKDTPDVTETTKNEETFEDAEETPF